MNNKKIYLALLFVFALTGCKEKVVDIQSGMSFDCAVHNNSVSCWGLYIKSGVQNASSIETENINSRKDFVKPTIAVGYNHYCVLDEGAVQCFLNNEAGQTEVPELWNPYEISAGLNYTCALDDYGLQCWGDYGSIFDTNPIDEPLENPRNLAAGVYQLCLTDDNGVHCAGMDYYNYPDIKPHEAPEGLTEVTQLTSSAASLNTCGLAEEWVCWNGFINPFPPELATASLVVPGSDQICAIVEGSVECWGDGSLSDGTTTWFINEKITNPFDISIGADGVCVAGDEGVYCENRYDPPSYIRAD